VGRARELYLRATAGPAYPADDGDRREVRLFGVDLPLRATIALLVVTLVFVLDFSRVLIPPEIQALGRDPAANRYLALERVLLFGLVPLAVVALAFRDAPARYGLRLGDWHWGLGLAAVGIAIVSPIILVLAARPEFAAYYAPERGALGDVVVTNALDLVPAEFILRGFLLFTLMRRIGPLALIVVQVPFVFAHVGKPEIELYSTFLGGPAFAWLNWRTGSIAWSAIGHVVIQTLVIMAAGAAV
jgi:membrane protease YdiL (CAAX protease family)